MTQSNPLELAKQGDPTAIAALMNRSLQPKGMMARAERIGDRLQVVLESEQVPNRQVLTTFVQNGMKSLGVTSIRSVRLFGKQKGVNTVAWTHDLELNPAQPAIGAMATPPPLPPLRSPHSPTLEDPSPTPAVSEEMSRGASLPADESPAVVPDESLETTEYLPPPSRPLDDELYAPHGSISPEATTTVEEDANYLLDRNEWDAPAPPLEESARLSSNEPTEDYYLGANDVLEPPPLVEDDFDRGEDLVIPSLLSDEDILTPPPFPEEDYYLTSENLDVPPLLSEDQSPLEGESELVPPLPPEETYYLDPTDDLLGSTDDLTPPPLLSEDPDGLDGQLNPNGNGDLSNGFTPPDRPDIYPGDPLPPSVVVEPDEPGQPSESGREGGPASFLFSGWAIATVALIFGILGFAVWSKYMTPSSPVIVESPEPSQPVPVPPSPTATIPAPPATSPSPEDDPLVAASDLGSQATALAASAQSVDDWNLAANQFQEAIALLQTVPQDSPNFAAAQQKISEYQPLLANAQQQATTLAATNSPAPTSTVTLGGTESTCTPVSSTAESQPVEISNLQIQAGEGNTGDVIIGCITNHTDQPISAISISYQGTNQDPNQPAQGGYSNITTTTLAPRETVPFTSPFTVNPGITNVSIESIFWTPVGTVEPQRIPASLVVSR